VVGGFGGVGDPRRAVVGGFGALRRPAPSGFVRAFANMYLRFRKLRCPIPTGPCRTRTTTKRSRWTRRKIPEACVQRVARARRTSPLGRYQPRPPPGLRPVERLAPCSRGNESATTCQRIQTPRITGSVKDSIRASSSGPRNWRGCSIASYCCDRRPPRCSSSAGMTLDRWWSTLILDLSLNLSLNLSSGLQRK
jgi:hypothetical protein